MLFLKFSDVHICVNHSVAILSPPTFALWEIANVIFNNSFHLLTALSYTQLLIVYDYLSGASVIVILE